MRSLAVVATGAVVVLTGCAHGTPAATSTPTDTVARFLQVMRMALPDASRDDAISIGRGVCDALGKGYTPAAIAAATLATGIDKANDRVIVQVSVLTFCPQYAVTVAKWTS